MQYVGQTERPLRLRFCEHRRAILQRNETNAIAKHFARYHPNYHISENDVPVTITPIEQIPDQGSKEANKAKRLDREQFWIDTLATFHPNGVNEDTISIKTANHAKPSIPFIVPFCKTGRDAADIAKNHFNYIQKEFEEIYNHRVIVAYKKHKNLHNLLISSKIRH